MSLTRTESVVLSPSEIRFRAFASLEYSETGEPLMTPGDFLDSLIQDRPRPRIKARVSFPICLCCIKYGSKLPFFSSTLIVQAETAQTLRAIA